LIKLQQIVSEGKELDIKAKIENAIDSMEILPTFTSRTIYKQKGQLGV